MDAEESYMNITYVLYHVSTQLHTIVRSWHGPLTADTQVEFVCAREDLRDDNLPLDAIIDYMEAWSMAGAGTDASAVPSPAGSDSKASAASAQASATLAQTPTTSAQASASSAHASAAPVRAASRDPQNIPLILAIGSGIAYAYITSEERTILIGPVCLGIHVQLNHHAADLTLSEEERQPIPCCGLEPFVAQILLLCNLFRNDWLDLTTVIKANCLAADAETGVMIDYSRVLFERQELSQPHNPYEQELRENDAIEQGDVERLRQSINEDYVGTVGTLSSNELRQTKNICIVVITLASRAAIRGGLPPEIAYSMSDAFIQHIESMNDANAAVALLRQTEVEYATHVAEIKAAQAHRETRPNMWTEQCKDYIFQHLHEKVTTKDVAEHLHLNANYLSEIFRDCEGMTITDYILQEKVKLTRNMLTYSPYSYVEIATYLGFSSQSHLGKVFKKYAGMTPRQYRERYGQGTQGTSSPAS